MNLVSPVEAMRTIAQAIPADCRKNMIIVASLAAGYRFSGGNPNMKVRTKDVDCLLSPRIEAIHAGVLVTERLLGTGWEIRLHGGFGEPGKRDTPLHSLPLVRLKPPGETEWFMELLTVPESESSQPKENIRLETRHGDFVLSSFKYMSLANFYPLESEFGIGYARPEMMALSNLLHHPEIGPEMMQGGFAGRNNIKRSNKDLGRVIALAHLTTEADEDALEEWGGQWADALQARFPTQWKTLAKRAGNGLKQLLDDGHQEDLEQAVFTCMNGLLAQKKVTAEMLAGTGKRVLEFALESLADRAG